MNANEIEELFVNEVQTIRRYFPASFDFKEIKAKGIFEYVNFYLNFYSIYFVNYNNIFLC